MIYGIFYFCCTPKIFRGFSLQIKNLFSSLHRLPFCKRRDRSPTYCGHFLCLFINIWVSTPVWSVNAPTASCRWKTTGKRNPLFFRTVIIILKSSKMKTTVQVPVKNEPESREEARQDRFFDWAMSNIPKSATIISARGIFSRGERSVSYTYRHAGRVFTTTLSTEGGVIA